MADNVTDEAIAAAKEAVCTEIEAELAAEPAATEQYCRDAEEGGASEL
jgi:hypothetical protein